MLAATLEDKDMDALSFPLLSSPKVDGIRCLVFPTRGPLSRSFKPIPNVHIRDSLEAAEAWYLDGEIITLSNGTVDSFNTIQSKVMSHTGKPQFIFLAFDYFESPSTCFSIRHSLTRWKASHIQAAGHKYVQSLAHKTIYDPLELLAQETIVLSSGFEGLMLRHPDLGYKSGRSTLLESGLLKLKRFLTAEGTIVNILPLLRNLNPQEKDNLGLARRSSHVAGKVEDSIMGSLVLDIGNGQHLSIGSGFTSAQRADIWVNQSSYLNKIVTYKYLSHGVKDLPRHPIFIGFRHEEDM